MPFIKVAGLVVLCQFETTGRGVKPMHNHDLAFSVVLKPDQIALMDAHDQFCVGILPAPFRMMRDSRTRVCFIGVETPDSIVLGADPLRMSVYSEVDPLPDGLSIVQVGLVDWDLAKNYGAEIALKADVKETLRALIPALKAAGGAALETRAKQGVATLASKNWTARRKSLVEQISKDADRSPIDPDWLALQVVEAMPANAILVDEGLTSSRQITALRPHRDRYGYHALASGGIGWGLPASVGVSIANPDRPVVCFSGDGSAMYSIQALWTAAHHKLPLTVVIVNNGGYRIIKQRLLAFHGDDHYVGMDFVDPPVDFCGLAKSFGLEAIKLTDPKELKSALSSAFSWPGAKLIEVVVNNSVN
jgi:benzoylformate decarboxylase